MGIKEYIKMTFKDDIKRNIPYILVLICSIVMIFNIFNISLNESIIKDASSEYLSISELGFVIMAVSVEFIIFANSYYMEGKYKEYAIVSISGSTMGGIGEIMIIRSAIITIISVSIGCIIGAATSFPVIKIITSLIGITGEVNVISTNAVITTALLMAVELETVFLINAGSMYRSNINELVNRKKRTSAPDKRQIKLWSGIYVFFYLLPIIAGLLPISASDKAGFIKITAIAGLFGIQGLVRHAIPKWIKNYRLKKLIVDKYNIIAASNIYVSIQKSISLILVLVLTIVLSIEIGSGYEIGTLINNMSLFCYGLIVIIMSFTVVYKFLIEAKTRVGDFKQLKLLGYTKKEIKEIILKEVIIYYLIISLLIIPYDFMLTISSVISGFMSIGAALLVVFFYIIVFAATAIISYKQYCRYEI